MTTRGRKPTSIAPAEKPVIDHDAGQRGTMALQAVAEQQQAAQANAVALAEQFGYEGALTVSGLEDEIRFYQRRSVEAVLETGKRLKLLKAIAGHGGFLDSLDRLGVEHRLAQRLIAATEKFSNAASTPLLTMPGMSQTKLLELLVLDDAEIEALDQGDTVRGVKLDDIDCMSVSELRRALRVSAAEQAAKLADKDAVIAQKAAKIDELVEAKNRRESLTGAELHDELERELTEATLTAIGTMTALRVRIDDINGLDKLPQGLYVACANALQRVVSEAMGIAADYGIQLTLAAELDGDGLFDDPNAGEDPNADDPEQAD
jgi:hypothetical protein